MRGHRAPRLDYDDTTQAERVEESPGKDEMCLCVYNRVSGERTDEQRKSLGKCIGAFSIHPRHKHMPARFIDTGISGTVNIQNESVKILLLSICGS